MTRAPGKTNTIPPGYKMTEVGVIPEDWEVDAIANCASVTTGSKDTQDRIPDGRYPFFVRSQIIERINTFSYDGEAVLTAGDGVGTGKVFHYINGKFDFHQRVYKVSDFKPKLNGFYFFKVFSNRFYDRIMSMTAKSSVDSVRREMIVNMLIPLPDTAEQRTIAGALSDVDELIESLEALIAKKRAIKTGTMQALLTPPGQPGHQRLPGFSGKWEVKRLGEFLTYERPDKYIVHDTDYSENGHVPVLTANKGFILGYTNETFGVCQETPVIVFDDFTTDSKYATFPFKVKSSAIKLLRARHTEVDLSYVFSRMQMMPFQVRDHKRHYISEYQALQLAMPKYDEQTAIAAILSDMDAEIAALEARLVKTRAIKQGMMQELLTGRVRLAGVGERMDRTDPSDRTDRTDRIGRRES
jgi:type I restriction enzyme, S subunit